MNANSISLNGIIVRVKKNSTGKELSALANMQQAQNKCFFFFFFEIYVSLISLRQTGLYSLGGMPN